MSYDILRDVGLTPQEFQNLQSLERFNTSWIRRGVGAAAAGLLAIGSWVVMAEHNSVTPIDTQLVAEAPVLNPEAAPNTALPPTIVLAAEATSSTAREITTTSTTQASETHMEAAAVNEKKITSRFAVSTLAQHTLGFDVSWPNCDTPIPEEAKFGIVGVNGGSPFEINPCLVQEVEHFKSKPLSLYVNSSYPGSGAAHAPEPLPIPCPVKPELCTAYEWGYVSGKHDAETAKSQNVHSLEWWIDVETQNAWRGNVHEHRTVLLAMTDAIRTYVSQNEGVNAGDIYIGFYSKRILWDRITEDKNAANEQDGLWRPKGYQGWAAIYVPETEVVSHCNDPNEIFTGEGNIMVQTVRRNMNNSGHDIDVDYRC
jgi:hypothetical protein